MQFAAFYGVALAHIDRGAASASACRGSRSRPLPNPLLVVPTPL
jgi:hypothetical protein